MLDHTLGLPELEVCGLLGGSGGLIKNYYAVDNIAEQRHRAFLMDPAGQIRAMRMMRERGETMAGIFHSHPDTPARPSVRDQQQARYANIYYFIASLQHSVPEIKAYYYDGNQFKNASITIEMIAYHKKHPDPDNPDEP